MSDDTATDRGWLRPRGSSADGVQCVLVVAFSMSEPERVGETLLLEGAGPWTFGRGEAGGGAGRATLGRVRPGGTLRTEPLSARGVSREQLKLRDEGGGALFVENVGKAPMRVSGVRVDSASVRPGSTVAIGDQIVFVAVARRHPAFLASAPRPTFAFGAADADGVVGESVAAWDLRDAVDFVAGREEHVLVTGESGTGKELVARALHRRSPRAAGPLVSRSAATLPEGLVDAELFGNVKGYPQAGLPSRRGLVGEADGGTMFLDEIGEISSQIQAHLLRVLDAGEYHRLGDDKPSKSRFRLVAATNRGPGELKHDLAARLVLRVAVPSLAERREDVPLLARAILRGVAARDPRAVARVVDERGEPRLAPDLVDALVRATYRTHVRELASLLWASLERSRGSYLDLDDEVLARLDLPEPEGPGEDLSREAIVLALQRNGGSVSKAAAALGLRNRAVLYRLMKKHGL